ncbi:molybdopterin molybdotransferase MoeA [Gracilibacillus caseinilyticus]|uniref:Molybdopterin molybdenumtransferase n=1 Tax=Gracilibacillus caseinilyticus TaxID=2932256 RepID=A0ABY4EUS2_9BACI|nr:gephyrin-like molybdotransferase Glp [Gracilibacillus caseinilyticus]UOQ48156.1 molybdopterin molybdotransferase MoeA [Gracilibacillus caseinilyticus]
MLNERNPIPVKEAIAKVQACYQTGQTEWVPVTEAATRILAMDITADHHVPPFDRSPYDGYALRSDDTTGASAEQPKKLEVVGHIGAGSVHSEPLTDHQAVRIMTGAAIPKGADAVVMLEDTAAEEIEGRTYVNIMKPSAQQQNISFKGEDVQKGEVIIKKGTEINPGVIALLATFGYASVPVAKKPVIGVIATGSELLEVSEPLEPGRIRNSNAYMISAQLERAGAIPRYYGQLADDLASSIEKISAVLEEVDFLITTGGVSVGDFDLLPEIYQALEADVLFNKVAMRPGSVTTVTTTANNILFGLSGNPSACYVGFELFTRPLIDHFLGKRQIGLPAVEAVLDVDIPKANPFSRFMRGYYYFQDQTVFVQLAGKDKSNMVHSLANANCLIELPGGTAGFNKGDRVLIHRLGE